jgi:hypothetical protein
MKPKYFLTDKSFEKTFNRYKKSLNEADHRKLKKQFEIFREDVFDKRLFLPILCQTHPSVL